MSAHETIGRTQIYILNFMKELTVRPGMYTGSKDLHVAEIMIVNNLNILAMLKDSTVNVRNWYTLRYPDIPRPTRTISSNMNSQYPGYQCYEIEGAKKFWTKESSALIRWSMENMEKER